MKLAVSDPPACANRVEWARKKLVRTTRTQQAREARTTREDSLFPSLRLSAFGLNETVAYSRTLVKCCRRMVLPKVTQ
jgi:hypothetical protein